MNHLIGVLSIGLLLMGCNTDRGFRAIKGKPAAKPESDVSRLARAIENLIQQEGAPPARIQPAGPLTATGGAGAPPPAQVPVSNAFEISKTLGLEFTEPSKVQEFVKQNFSPEASEVLRGIDAMAFATEQGGVFDVRVSVAAGAKDQNTELSRFEGLVDSQRTELKGESTVIESVVARCEDVTCSLLHLDVKAKEEVDGSGQKVAPRAYVIFIRDENNRLPLLKGPNVTMIQAQGKEGDVPVLTALMGTDENLFFEGSAFSQFLKKIQLSGEGAEAASEKELRSQVVLGMDVDVRPQAASQITPDSIGFVDIKLVLNLKDNVRALVMATQEISWSEAVEGHINTERMQKKIEIQNTSDDTEKAHFLKLVEEQADLQVTCLVRCLEVRVSLSLAQEILSVDRPVQAVAAFYQSKNSNSVVLAQHEELLVEDGVAKKVQVPSTNVVPLRSFLEGLKVPLSERPAPAAAAGESTPAEPQASKDSSGATVSGEAQEAPRPEGGAAPSVEPSEAPAASGEEIMGPPTPEGLEAKASAEVGTCTGPSSWFSLSCWKDWANSFKMGDPYQGGENPEVKVEAKEAGSGAETKELEIQNSPALRTPNPDLI